MVSSASVKRTARTLDWATVAAAVAALLAGGQAALAGESNRDPTVGGISHSEPADQLQVVHGYRSTLGLRLRDAAIATLGGGNATARLLARYAQASDVPEPLVYTVERAPLGPGLRGSEQVTGLILRRGEGWSSAFEASTSTDAFTAARRTMLSGQLYAPLAGGAGLSLGLSYSTWQAPAPGNDTVLSPGYAVLPGRVDAGTQQLGYQLQLNYLYGERNLVALTYNSRREPEQYRLAPDPLASDARQLSLTGEHWFSPSWAVRYDIPAHKPGNLIRRQGLRLGLHYRF